MFKTRLQSRGFVIGIASLFIFLSSEVLALEPPPPGG